MFVHLENVYFYETKLGTWSVFTIVHSQLLFLSQ